MKTIYKQERWGFVASLITNAGMAALLVWYIVQKDSTMTALSAAILIYCIVLLIDFFKTSITVDENSIRYTTLFKDKRMRFDAMRKIESKANMTGGSPNGVSAKYQTILYSDSDKISIGIKTFPKRSLMEFATILITRCTHAIIDDGTKYIMEGKMPSAFIKYKKHLE